MKKKNIFCKKIIVAILIMQMIVMTCLSVMVIMEITKNSKNTAINNLQTIVQERSQIVDNYVQESEVILSAYSKAGEVLNVLKIRKINQQLMRHRNIRNLFLRI